MRDEREIKNECFECGRVWTFIVRRPRPHFSFSRCWNCARDLYLRRVVLRPRSRFLH